MKKTIVPVLICLYLITAGITYIKLEPDDIVAAMDDKIDAIEPQVEYIERVSTGESGGLLFDIRAYQDGSGYHLYYSNAADVDATYDLTKAEFLQCTDITHEGIKELENAEIYQGEYKTYDEVTVKFKGEDEIVVPAKAYQDNFLMTLQYYADLKTGNYNAVSHSWFGNDLEGKVFPQINDRINKYFLLNKVSNGTIHCESYNEGGGLPGMSTTQSGCVFIPSRFEFAEYLSLFEPEELVAKSDAELAESGISKIVCNGKEAYFLCVTSEDALAVFMYFPDEMGYISIDLDIPENTTKEELKADLTMLLDDKAVKDPRGKIIAIESVAFGIVIVVSIILVFVNRSEEDSNIE